jgi:hypothetical protein
LRLPNGNVGNRAGVLRPGVAHGAARWFGGHAYTPPRSPRGLPDIPRYGLVPWRSSSAYVENIVLTRLRSPGVGKEVRVPGQSVSWCPVPAHTSCGASGSPGRHVCITTTNTGPGYPDVPTTVAQPPANQSMMASLLLGHMRPGGLAGLVTRQGPLPVWRVRAIHLRLPRLPPAPGSPPCRSRGRESRRCGETPWVADVVRRA